MNMNMKFHKSKIFVLAIFFILFTLEAFCSQHCFIPWEESDCPDQGFDYWCYLYGSIGYREIKYNYLIETSSVNRIVRVGIVSWTEFEEGQHRWEEIFSRASDEIDSDEIYDVGSLTSSNAEYVVYYSEFNDNFSISIEAFYKGNQISIRTGGSDTGCWDATEEWIVACDTQSVDDVVNDCHAALTHAIALIDEKCPEAEADEQLILETCFGNSLTDEGNGEYSLILEYHDFEHNVATYLDTVDSCWGATELLFIRNGLAPYTHEITQRDKGNAALQLVPSESEPYLIVSTLAPVVDQENPEPKVGDFTITLKDSNEVSSQVHVTIIDSHFARATFEAENILYIPYLKIGDNTMQAYFSIWVFENSNGVQLSLEEYFGRGNYAGVYGEYVASFDLITFPYTITVPHLYINGTIYQLVLELALVEPKITFDVKNVVKVSTWQ